MLKLQKSEKHYKRWNLYHISYGKWRAAKIEGNKVKYITSSSEKELRAKIDKYKGR